MKFCELENTPCVPVHMLVKGRMVETRPNRMLATNLMSDNSSNSNYKSSLNDFIRVPVHCAREMIKYAHLACIKVGQIHMHARAYTWASSAAFIIFYRVRNIGTLTVVAATTTATATTNGADDDSKAISMCMERLEVSFGCLFVEYNFYFSL